MVAVETPYICWNNSFSVGVPEIDSQHGNLLNLINDLAIAMRRGEGRALVGDILDKLIRYTKSHFAAEEKLMKMHRYPGYQGHQIEHEAFTAKVVAFQEQFEAGNAPLSVDLLPFMADWLTHHILGSDQLYRPWFE